MGLVTSSQPKRKSAFKLIYRFGTPYSNFLTIKYSLKRKAEMVLKKQIETGELLLVSKAGLSSCFVQGLWFCHPPLFSSTVKDEEISVQQALSAFQA